MSSQIVHNDDVLMMSLGRIKHMLWTRHTPVLNVPTTVCVIEKQDNVNASKDIVEMRVKNPDVIFVWYICNVNIRNVQATATVLPPERPTMRIEPHPMRWNTRIGTGIIPHFVIVNVVTMGQYATTVCVPRASTQSTYSHPTSTRST